MNSKSRTYYYKDDCNSHKQCNSCKGKEKEIKGNKCPTIIKCGTPGAAAIPEATVIGTTLTPTSLTLDTSPLCKPCTKFEFTSNIVATAFTGSISFQVFKQCNNQFAPVPVGPAFTYSRIVAVTDSDTFSFFICDCDGCVSGCCNYTVVATVNAVTAGVLNINNATLGAISTCQLCQLCEEYDR